MDEKKHWETVYQNKKPTEVSWFQPKAEVSFGLIQELKIEKDTPIIDVGGGASNLASELLKMGYTKLSVLDISKTALKVAQDNLGKEASKITWIETDIRNADLPSKYFGLWHDRATFHFLTDKSDRTRYVEILKGALKPNGYLIMATFAIDGPTRCSGLDIIQFSPELLEKELGNDFKMINAISNIHLTPNGSTQRFNFCLFQNK